MAKRGQLKNTNGGYKGDSKKKFEPRELWKAQQLKEYRRANGLCFSYGEKYTPTHQCANKVNAQLKAMELDDGNVFLSDEVLDAITGLEGHMNEEVMYLSYNAIAGTENPRIIRI